MMCACRFHLGSGWFGQRCRYSESGAKRLSDGVGMLCGWLVWVRWFWGWLGTARPRPGPSSVPAASHELLECGEFVGRDGVLGDMAGCVDAI